MRYGELAHFKLIPHTPYYGTADATPLYLITLHAAWRATGDRDLLERHLETAEGCLSWIDDYGDRDGDGFQEYQTRSPVGYENMGWKDSGDCVVYPDGSLVKGPKALCELQGYVYDAWVRMAEVFDALGKPERAQALRAKASALFDRFNEAFWDEELGFYAYALDGEKRKVLTVASNAGHCLWSGIVPPERAKKVVERLMAPDMWSGWGIRTLSAEQSGLQSVQLSDRVRLAARQCHHRAWFQALRFQRRGGADRSRHQRRSEPLSVQPAAGALYCFRARRNQLPGAICRRKRAASLGSRLGLLLTQAMLGFLPDAPRNKLYVDPSLPTWLPDLAVHDLAGGSAQIDIRFWREGEHTAFEVTKGDPQLVERCAFATKFAQLRTGSDPI